MRNWLEFSEEKEAEKLAPRKRYKSTLSERMQSPWYNPDAAKAKVSAPREEWTETKKIKHSLLRRAFDEHRGGEVILRIQWCVAREGHLNSGFAAAYAAFEKKYFGEPQAIRALNLLEERLGLMPADYRYDKNAGASAPSPAPGE